MNIQILFWVSLYVFYTNQEELVLLFSSVLLRVIQEMLLTTTSERYGRAIDKDQGSSMENKKQQGYF